MDDGTYPPTDYDALARKAWKEDRLGHRIDYADHEAGTYRSDFPASVADFGSRSVNLRAGGPSGGLEQSDLPGIGGVVYTDPSRDVFVTLPDGRHVKFTFYLELIASEQFGMRQTFAAKYLAPAHVNATLEMTDAQGRVGGNELMSLNLMGIISSFYWKQQPPGDELAGAGDFYDTYDIPGYRLTTSGGTQFYLGKTHRDGNRLVQMDGSEQTYMMVNETFYDDLHLTKIVDLNGNELDVSSKGIVGRSLTDLNTASIHFQRDSQGRLSGVVDSDGATLLTYNYNLDGDLESVTRQVKPATATTPAVTATTRYLYEHKSGHSTHRIVSIISPSGKQPITNEYDTSGRLIATTDAFGKRIEYTHDLAARQEIVRDRSGGETLYVYDALGNVLSKTDPAGQTTQYTYVPGTNWEASVTTAAGTPQAFTTYYQRDNWGNKTSESYTVDGVTLTQQWGYWAGDPNKLLYSVDQQGLRTENTYDAKGNLTQTIAKDRDGVLTAKTTFDGYQNGQPTVVTQYGSAGVSPAFSSPYLRTVSVYNSQGSLVESRQEKADGTVLSRTTYTVDSHGNVTGTTRYKPDTNGNWTIALPGTTNVYDEQGRTTDTYTPDGQGGLLHTQTIYNADGQVWKTIDARGNCTVNEYDELGQVTATRQYSAAGKLLSSTGTTHTADGKVATSTDALGNVTSSYYDVADRSVRTVSPDAVLRPDLLGSTSSETLYDAAGRAYLTIDRHVANQLTELRGTMMLYDAAGRTTGTERLSGITLTITADEDKHQATVTADQSTATVLSSTTTHYNAKGQVDYTISETGQWTETLYDDAGRQWKVTEKAVPTWNQTTNATEPTDLVTEYHYDSMGRQDWVKAPTAWAFDLITNTYTLVAAKTSYEYDQQGRVTKTTFNDNSFTQTHYDALGRKDWEEDQLHRRTDYTYDDVGHLTSVTLPAVLNDHTGQMERPGYVYRYDAYGNLHEQQDAGGRVTTFTYDNFNRRWTRTRPAAVDADGIALGTATETTLYDDLGREQSVTDFAGTVKWDVYNNLGRLSDVFYFASGIAPNDQGTGASDHIAYQYDAMGRQWHITDTKDNDHDGVIEAADGDYVRTTTNDYDAENRLTLVDAPEGKTHYAFNDLGQQTDTWTATDAKEQATTWTHYDYDQIGRLLDVIARRLNGQDVSIGADYAYTAGGQLTHQVNANGVTSDWSFDSLGRLVQLAHKTSGETLATFRYTRDAVGQIKHTDESGPAVFGGSRSVDYQYDAINRLTEEVRHEGDNSTTTTDYYFDLVGNRLRQVINAVTTSYSYNARDEKLSETAGSTTTRSYYDANGSLKQTKQGETVTAEYQYDLRNKMIEAAVNGAVARYVYDHNGLVVSRQIVGGDGETYLRDLQNPTGYGQVIEQRQNGALVRSFLIGRSILAQADGSTVGYLLADHQGSTRALLDATGQVITGKILAYDAFGRVISGSGLALPAYQFAMQRIDDFTGWSDNQIRWYNLAGRWTQTDPRLNPVGDLVNFNGQLYCNGNPLGGTDPSGNCDIPSFVVSAGIQGSLYGGAAGAILGGTYGALKTGTARGAIYGAIAGGFAGAAFGGLAAAATAWGGAIWAAQAGITVVEGQTAVAVIMAAPLKVLAAIGLANAIAHGDWVDVTFAGVGFVGAFAGPITVSMQPMAGRMPRRLARVVDADVNLNLPNAMLRGPGAKTVLVTGTEDIYSLGGAKSVAQRLTLLERDSSLQPGPFKIIEFDAPEGMSPLTIVDEGWPGFQPGGLTKGQAREFSIPNLRLSDLRNVIVKEAQ